MRRKTIDTIPVLSDAMKNILSAFSKSRSLPSGLVKRATIVLLASQGELNQNIALQVGLHYNNVATWRSRFLAALGQSGQSHSGNGITVTRTIVHRGGL